MFLVSIYFSISNSAKSLHFNNLRGENRTAERLTCLMERSCRFQAFQDDVHPFDRFLSRHRLQQDEGQTSDFGEQLEHDGHGKCNTCISKYGIFHVRKESHYISM